MVRTGQALVADCRLKFRAPDPEAFPFPFPGVDGIPFHSFVFACRCGYRACGATQIP
jgi:hypothetical protein